MKSRKKKAFTLTELLIVVIVIGILSAAVLPKFNKVLETRKTTEAEEMMAAVRTEQEKRCALDQKYQTEIVKLAEIIPQEESKNFSYSLTTTGIEAQSKGKYGYTLKMPSYADGRLCCEDAEECAKLNKDYPLCSELIARADYQDGQACEGKPLQIECVGESSRACGCENKGTQTRTCDTTTGAWGAWGACSISDICPCTEGAMRTTDKRCFSSGCGREREVCKNGEWTYATCVPVDGPCPPGTPLNIACSNGKYATAFCNAQCQPEGVDTICDEVYPPSNCEDSDYKLAHKSECCPEASTSDTVCYTNCNCSPQVSATSPQTVRQEQAVCKKVSGTCKWTHRQSYKTQSECYNYVLSQVSLPQGGSVSCTFVNNPLNTSMYPPAATGCMERGGSCYVKSMFTPPSYSVEKSTFRVSLSCQRCKNGW